jgi:hypothetical protein
MPWVTVEEYRRQRRTPGRPVNVKKMQANSRAKPEESGTKAKKGDDRGLLE